MDELHINIGKRMKIARKHLKYTQEEMAEILNISVKHYGDVERGNAGVSLETLLEIANILNLSLDYLIKGTEMEQSYIPQKWLDLYLACPAEKRIHLLNILEEVTALR